MLDTPPLSLLLWAPALLASSGFGSPRSLAVGSGGPGWTPGPRLCRSPEGIRYAHKTWVVIVSVVSAIGSAHWYAVHAIVASEV